MKIQKKKISLEDGLKEEWLITNGLGGYSSSTIINCNTRKYHGLLIAPMTPPARRHLIISKVDESIQIGNMNYNLYTNMSNNYISDGYKYLESFEKEYIPVFTYKIGTVEIKKSICMKYGENTVGILYNIKNGLTRAKFSMAPIINFRDFHRMNTAHDFNIKQEVKDNTKVKLVVDDYIDMPIYMNCNEAFYTQHYNDTFRNMYYIEEEKRGLYPEENHAVPGVFEVEIEPNEEKEISLVCSLEENIEEINVQKLINDEIKRIDKQVSESKLVTTRKIKLSKEEQDYKDLMKYYIMAVDNFIVYRPSFSLHTMIAGYPWFLDWGRDALISYEGILLKTKKFKLAQEVLLTFTKNIKFGLVPNGYSGFDNRPLYNSADASLLMFEQVHKYIAYTGDKKFIKKELYKTMQGVIRAYQNGIYLDDNNIYMDGEDNLLVSGTPQTQNTWMDAKYGDYAVTPRNGKAVEINALWYNALKVMEELTEEFDGKEKAEYYKDLATKCKKSFEEKFYNPKKKCLYDVLGDEKIRPNQLMALSLSHPVINPASEIAMNIYTVATKKLLNKHGLKTLAKGEENYVEVYEGDPFKRDMSYHQGITWPWLLGLYYDTMKNMLKSMKKSEAKEKLQEEYNKFVQNIEKTFTKAVYNDGCLGSISELYDSRTPYEQKGCVAQAWSVAEVFRIIVENHNK